MHPSDTDAYFEHKGVKPTANRILVLKALLREAKPMSLTDLEAELETMDKSSIYRVLSLFLEHDIAHAFEDGRGVMNYELCASEERCDHTDGHVHFYCEKCRRSFCMEHLQVPDFALPEGFKPRSVSFVIKGECPQCGGRTDGRCGR